MTVRNLSPATQRSYLHAVAKFSRHFGRSPDLLGIEDVRAFQVFLVSQGISWPALNQTVCGLRFFYGVTLRRATIAAIAADPRHLGAEIGFIAILHSWGQTLTHHPHIHCVIPGGGPMRIVDTLPCPPPAARAPP